MNVTPESGPNLAFWGLLPMSVSNYGGDLQVCTLPEYLGGPLQFGFNPVGDAYISSAAGGGINLGGGMGSAQVDMNAVYQLGQMFSAGANQNFTAQQYSQSAQGATALKTTLNSLLLNQSATTEDRDKANEYLKQIDKFEAELNAMKGQNLTTQEVYDKSAAIEKELRKIATKAGELNSKVMTAANEAAQAAQQQQQQDVAQADGKQSASVATENADPEAERKSQT